jgi:hypothetical protein
MSRFNSPLERVRVAAPCTADWDSMLGDERVRFCRHCELNVYNLSGMSKREAERVVAGAEGRLCVRFYRRADGSVLTQNCPVGLRALKRRVSRVANAVASAAVGFFAGLGLTPSPRPMMMMGAAEFRPVPPPPAAPAPAVEEADVAMPMLGAAVVEQPIEGWVVGRMAVKPIKEKRAPGRGKGRRVRVGK